MKRRSALLYGPYGSGRTLRYLITADIKERLLEGDVNAILQKQTSNIKPSIQFEHDDDNDDCLSTINSCTILVTD